MTIDSLKKDYQKNINLDYLLALEDIRGSDQTIRRLIKVPDSLFAKLDSINYQRTKVLLKKYGYPNIKKDGFEGTQHVYLTLLHATMYSENQYQEILEILEKAILDFAFRKSNLAQVIDRREVWYNKKDQLFGTWNNYGAKEFKPISNIEGVDKRRFEYNLLRLKEQGKLEKRTLPNQYKTLDYPENYFCGYQFQLTK